MHTSIHPVQVCLRALGFAVKKADVLDLMDQFDKDQQSPGLEFAEFNKIVTQKYLQRPFSELVDRAFAAFDIDGTTPPASCPPAPAPRASRHRNTAGEERSRSLSRTQPLRRAGKGRISQRTLRKVVAEVGEEIGEEELHDMIAMFDKDGARVSPASAAGLCLARFVRLHRGGDVW